MPFGWRLVRVCVEDKNAIYATLLLLDNDGTLKLAYTETSSEKIKHINVKVFLCKEMAEDRSVVFKYIPSKENAADIFTNALTVQEHNPFV